MRPGVWAHFWGYIYSHRGHLSVYRTVCQDWWDKYGYVKIKGYRCGWHDCSDKFKMLVWWCHQHRVSPTSVTSKFGGIQNQSFWKLQKLWPMAICWILCEISKLNFPQLFSFPSGVHNPFSLSSLFRFWSDHLPARRDHPFELQNWFTFEY